MQQPAWEKGSGVAVGMRIIVAAGMATALNSAAAFSLHVPSVASLAGERNVAINCRGASVFGARVNAQRLRGPPALRQSGTPLDQARALPPLDLTEENVNKALEETKEVLGRRACDILLCLFRSPARNTPLSSMLGMNMGKHTHAQARSSAIRQRTAKLALLAMCRYARVGLWKVLLASSTHVYADARTLG